jgi:diadenosine tetraphosphatase ApaH/serine/threonine PP2A family protein phosphatase
LNLSLLVEEAKAVQSSDFIEILEQTLDLLRRENGKTGNQMVSGRLVKLQPLGEALVIGDLHGDLESLLTVLNTSAFMQKMTNLKETTLIFLGDYGDRGAHSTEVYYILMRLKLAFPKQVVILRGNHEGPEDLMASPHNLPLSLQSRFGENWKTVYSKTRELFACLYNALLVDERYLMVHGGLSPNIDSVQDLANANIIHPKNELLENLLWSDHNDQVKDVLNSPRGAGKLFGKSVTEKVLRKLNVKILIRGHEPCKEGFKLNHNGKVLTLFSRKGAPYFNAYGAYLQLPLSKKFESARQLLPWIHKF